MSTRTIPAVERAGSDASTRISRRAEALAVRLEQGADALAELAGTLTEAEWPRSPVSSCSRITPCGTAITISRRSARRWGCSGSRGGGAPCSYRCAMAACPTVNTSAAWLE